MNGRIYELVSGERRLKASKLAGFESIPAILLTLGDRDVTAVAMNENIHSLPYSYLEYTEGLKVLDRGFGYSLDTIAELLAKSVTSFKDIHSLLSLSDEQRNKLMLSDISQEQAKLLVDVSDNDIRSELLDNVCRYRLNTEQTRELLTNILRRKGIIAAADKGKTEHLSKGIKHKLVNINNIRLFTNALKQAVMILKACGVTTECKVSRVNGSCEVRIKLADEL
jgi:ParB family chromosome partitioning protein